MDNTQSFTVHGKVDGVLQDFIIVNPTNLLVNAGAVPGELEDTQGKKLMVTRTIITFPNRMQLVVEETPEELVKMFRGGTDAPTGE